MHQVFTGSRFMLFWILGSLVAVFLSVVATAFAAIITSILVGMVILTDMLPPLMTTNVLAMIAFIGIGSIMGLATGSLQVAVIQQKWNVAFTGWRWLSLVGGVVGVVLTALIIGVPLREAFLNMQIPSQRILLTYGVFPFVMPLVCLSLAQLPVLMRYVRGAWLWVLANAVAGLVMYTLLMSIISGATLIFWVWIILAMAVSPAIVTGFAMYFLMQFNQHPMLPGDFQ
ncbi:MAG: hypothetical protein ACPG7F_13570 [Aggregatilineales bacterium]